MFSLTSAAAQQIQQSAQQTGAQHMALRVAARVDEDGSLHFGMGFDDPQDDDIKLDLEGVAVVIADEYQELMDQMVLDFVEMEPGEFNFIFTDGRANANAPQRSSSGGCGSGACGGGGCGSGGGGGGCAH